MESRVFVDIENRTVAVRAWRFLISGAGSFGVQVFLLDTALPENSDWDRSITDHLYGGDDHYRLCQEIVLGMGGVALLDRLGYTGISSYHMNEGHSALLTLALLHKQTRGNLAGTSDEDIEAVRSKCVFTTHTPVPAGHDQFSRDAVRQVLGAPFVRVLEITNCCPNGVVNMTFLALRFSRYINGVAMHHGEVSRDMFPRYPVRAITNGVHAATWTSGSFQSLFDRHIPEWRSDNQYLRYAIGIPAEEIREAHAQAKMNLHYCASRAHRYDARSRHDDDWLRTACGGLQARRSRSVRESIGCSPLSSGWVLCRSCTEGKRIPATKTERR